MKTGACFSPCRKYRYILWRVWSPGKPLMTWVMLNPSTADEIANDPTIERCERRARFSGFGGILVVNLFAYRATNPEEMKAAMGPIGDYNPTFIRRAAVAATISGGMVVCGWGEHGAFRSQGSLVRAILHHHGVEPYVLALNKSGEPKHPLYVGYKTAPRPWISEEVPA